MKATGFAVRGLVSATAILVSTHTLADTTSPANLRYAVYSQTAAELFWNRASTDSGYVSAYEISRDGVIIDTRDGLSLFMADLQAGVENVFTVTAISSTGERSDPVSVSIDTGSGTPPFESSNLAAPTGLSSSRYSTQAFELFWDRVEGQAYQYDVSINGEAAGSTDGTSFFIGDETPFHDGSGELTVALVARDAAGAQSAQTTLTLAAGGDDTGSGGGEIDPPDTDPETDPDTDDALLSLDRASDLLQQLTELMRSNGLTEHQSSLRFLNSSYEDNYVSEEVLEAESDFYDFSTLYLRECVNGGSVVHWVDHHYHTFYQHDFDMDDCRIPGYRFVSGVGTYINRYDGSVYGRNVWTGYAGAYDALVVEQGDIRETMTASTIHDHTTQNQIRNTDRYNVRRYLRIENGEYDYSDGELDVSLRDLDFRFNRFDPNTGQHAFNRLNAAFTVSAGWTDGQSLAVNAVFDGNGEAAPWFDSGSLRIVDEAGNSLEVLAGTGNPETYQLVSTVDGVTVSEIRRWDVNGCELVNTYWQDNLDREQCVLMPPLG